MAERTFHAAIALIKVGDKTIGRMTTLRVNENYRRNSVRVIGTIYSIEEPAVEHGGSLTASFVELAFNQTGIPGAINRNVQNKQEFEDTLLLSEVPVTLNIFKKVSDVINERGIVIPKLVPYAIIDSIYLDSDSFNIAQGTIAVHDQTFRFTEPIIYPA